MKIKKAIGKKKKKKKINFENLTGKIDKKFLFLPFLLIIVFLIDRKYSLFGVLTLLLGVFSYFHDKFNKTDLDFKMSLFLGIIITRHYGLGLTAIFFVLSDLIPSFLGGARLEGNNLFFYGLFFAVNSLVLLFPQTDIIFLGMILVLVDFVGSIIIKRFFGIPIVMSLLSSAFSVLIRIVYFLTLGEILQFLFGVI